MKILGVNSIQDLNEYLNEFKWACCYRTNDKWYINQDPSEKTWSDNYITLTSKQFLQLKAGCCWDYVNFEYMYFKENFPTYPIKCYYFEIKNSITHTWLCFLSDGYNIFESSFKSYIGIYHYKTEEEMLNRYIPLLLKRQNDSYKVYSYIPTEKQLNCEEFANYVYTTGKLVREDD